MNFIEDFQASSPPDAVVVMGVSGCGKSSVSAGLAEALGWLAIEGDSFHSPANRAKMSQGVPLTDEDRAGWLDSLAAELRRHAGTPHNGLDSGSGAVLSCSALKRAYRDRLRQAVPGLRFVYLEISREVATQRVSSRPGHFFHASLVDSQFATLEPPVGEAGVLCLPATQPLDELIHTAARWLVGVSA